MIPALRTSGLSKRYGRLGRYGRHHWALRQATLTLPQGSVTALLGPNGAGKTTLMHLAVGLLAPTGGAIEVYGRPLRRRPADLARVAFVAQDKPLYAALTVAETLTYGAAVNPRFDHALAHSRIRAYDLPPRRKVAQLSGGQRALLALALALGKRAELLILDEPLADLDPLARHEVMGSLMSAVAEGGLTALLSSHVLADLADTCDHLLLLAAGELQLAGDLGQITAAHHLLTGPDTLPHHLPAATQVVELTTTGRQSTALIRGPAPAQPAVHSRTPALEEIVLAYMRNPAATALPRPTLTSAASA